MTPVSRRELDKQTKEILDGILINMFVGLTKKEIISVLNTLLTETEIEMLRKRAGIYFLHQNNLSNENCASITKTTRQTVSRILAILALAHPKDRKIVSDKLKIYSRKVKAKDSLKSIISINLSRSYVKRKVSKLL